MIESKLSPIAIKGGGSSLSLLCGAQIAKRPECSSTRAAAVGSSTMVHIAEPVRISAHLKKIVKFLILLLIC